MCDLVPTFASGVAAAFDSINLARLQSVTPVCKVSIMFEVLNLIPIRERQLIQLFKLKKIN